MASPVVGAQTLCIGDTCGRVWVKDPDAQTNEEAQTIAQEAVDEVLAETSFLTHFPQWRVVTTGPVSGVGGSTDAENLTIRVYASPGRTHDEYVTTVLHEMGHVVDFEWVTDSIRFEYRAIRGLQDDVPWSREVSDDVHGDDRWRFGQEDLAEIVVAILTDGDHVPRSDAIAAAPEPDDLDRIARLIDPDGVFLVP